MSNVASLELCKELFELSGWDGTHSHYAEHELDGNIVLPYCDNEHRHEAPAYDLGYLLRKLKEHSYVTLKCSAETERQWVVGTGHGDIVHLFRADTPEGAACNLAIELFKDGVLAKGGK